PSAKLVFLLRHFLWSHREALNNEIFSSYFATYKISSLSESRSCIAFPVGTALGLSTTCWCHFSRRPRKPAVEGSFNSNIFEENERENVIAESHYKCRKQYLKYE
uniref:Uncharacterized protein n=1 Tax=Catharus ustulatus TaxID=91951 RepID=A0A8C3TP39_CATUS